MAQKQRNKLSVLVVNGPNLNVMGAREPKIYGSTTYPQLVRELETGAHALGLNVTCKQSNHEGQLIDWVQSARTDFEGVIINPGGYSHTSIALMDALKYVDKPVIEVHLSNIHAREEFRHQSYVSRVVDAVICGCGPSGYLLAMQAMVELISARKKKG